MNIKKTIANIAGTPGYLSWFLGVLGVMAGIIYWIAARFSILEKPSQIAQQPSSSATEPSIIAIAILTLISFVAWYFIANFARQLVWSIKRYTTVSTRKFQALLMLDLTIAWLLIGVGLFIAGFEPGLIIVVVGIFSIVGYVSLALEFYLRALWKLPNR